MDGLVGNDGIVTTEDEIEGYHIVKSILRQTVDASRITMRDTKSYCGILLDNTNRKPLCRLHFNTAQKYLGLFSQKNEDRVPIESVDDIYKYSEQIKATLLEYEGEKDTTKNVVAIGSVATSPMSQSVNSK